jgi:hypothetical protein
MSCQDGLRRAAILIERVEIKYNAPLDSVKMKRVKVLQWV